MGSLPTSRYLALCVLYLWAAVEMRAECIAPSTPCQAFASAPNVFVARVVEAQILEEIDELGPVRMHAKLFIEHVFKGIPGLAGTAVETEQVFGYDWVKPRAGERYLVYARENLQFSGCSGTVAIGQQRSFPILERLGTGKRAPAFAGFVGASADDLAPVPGAKFRFQATHAHAMGRTESDGTFLIESLPAGFYTVYISHNDYHWQPSRDRWDQIEVPEDGCAEANFHLRPANAVSGRVLDAMGQPAKNVYLVLHGVGENWGKYPPWLSVYSGSRGKFSFHGILPGKYRVEAPWLHSAGQRYLTQTQAADNSTGYYPGTLDPAAARIIEIERHTELDLGGFRLPE